MEKVIFENIEYNIYKDIVESTDSIEVAVAWFTNQRIFNLLCEKLRKRNGANVSIIMVNDPINIKKGGVDWQKYIELGGKLFLSSDDKLMHHKFCVLDSKILYNGSYNWTYGAEEKNIENVIRFEDQQGLIKDFQIHFNQLKEKVGLVEEVKYYSVEELEQWISSKDATFTNELKYEWEENIKTNQNGTKDIEDLLIKLGVLSDDSIVKIKKKNLRNKNTGVCKKCGNEKEYSNKPLCLKCFRSCRRCGNPKEYDKHLLCLSCYKTCPGKIIG